MPATVSDTSGLNYLALSGQFELLRQLYQAVLVPVAVWEEIQRRPDLPGAELAARARAAGWIEVAAPRNAAAVRELLGELGTGEAEAIVLAEERQPGILLMDESLGRQIARDRGLMLVGTLGVLLEGKRRGHLPELKPVLDDLVVRRRFRVSARLVDAVPRMAGEN